MGECIYAAQRIARSKVRDALFSQRHDDLWTCRHPPRAKMAIDGFARSIEWMDPVWTDGRVFVQRDTTNLASPQSHEQFCLVLFQSQPTHGRRAGLPESNPVSIDNGRPRGNRSRIGPGPEKVGRRGTKFANSSCFVGGSIELEIPQLK